MYEESRNKVQKLCSYGIKIFAWFLMRRNVGRNWNLCFNLHEVKLLKLSTFVLCFCFLQ